MSIYDLSAYEVIKKEDLKEIDSIGYLVRHKKSGARLALISNDDENKVFQIGFRTPPYNDTGLPHIMEHSVLCGSKHYPVKDPFVELMKGSLNTFLNAMTYPDKTVYPVASCNDKDFQNLMNVYLDAVLYPNIHTKEEIFRQEGWSYQLESKDAPLTYNGVVYNEMKGAYSSPDELLGRQIQHALFPDTCYGCDSGGDPDSIPSLSYEEFKAFHKRYYHPSNSYIYLYGNMDMEEKLKWLDEAYLREFDRIDIDSRIPMQRPFGARRDVVIEYPVASGEPEEERTYLSWNVLAGHELDAREYLAFEVVNYALLAKPGAELREALLEAGIGKDISGGFNNGIAQPYFSVIAKEADLSQKDAFLKVIHDVLNEVAENGFDKETLLAGINGMEFRSREVDFGRYPKGLIFGFMAMDSWLYDEDQPFLHLKTDGVYAFLKEQIDKGYFESLVKEYLLKEDHAAFVAAVPKAGLTSRHDKELEEKLAAYKASLSDEELECLVERTHALAAYQEEPTSKEALESIPLLKLSDIKKEVTPITYEVKEVSGVTLVDKDLFTNRIAYLNFAFRMEGLPERLLPYAGLLKYILGYIDTEKHTYAELGNEINIHSGGINFEINVYEHNKDDSFVTAFECDAKVLYEELPFALAMAEEILLHTKFEDERRILDILNEVHSSMSINLPNSATASRRAMSYFAPSFELREIIGGVTFFKWLEELIDDFDAKKEALKAALREAAGLLFTKANLVLNFTANKEAREVYLPLAETFVEKLPAGERKACDWKLVPVQRNEGLKTSSQIQYVAQAGDFKKSGFEYTGALWVLRTIMNSDYLWMNIRVRGGAYGCGCNFTRNGAASFSTYRDPHLARSKDVFAAAGEYLRNFDCDDREMLKYIIGTVSTLDSPLTPGAKAEQALTAYFTETTNELRQKNRDEVLGCEVSTIRSFAALLDAVMAQGYFCVIGNEEKIEASNLFMEKKVLIH